MKKISIQSIYQKTIAFAAEHHGQQKTPNGLPYIVHLSNVAMEVFMAHRKNPDFDLTLAVQLALLHDVLEDTQLSFKELKNEFSLVIANGVLALTKNKALEKKDQMNDCLSRILKQNIEVAIVKLCDRITNLQKPPAKWDKKKIYFYYEQTIVIQERLCNVNSCLNNRLIFEIDNYKLYL